MEIFYRKRNNRIFYEKLNIKTSFVKKLKSGDRTGTLEDEK
jgi:hypothetical protein